MILMSFTRREFASLGALGLAARFAPPLLAQTPGRQTGYAIIGLGRIAAIFMAGVRNSTNSKVTALVSGHRDKALRIAADYGVPESSIYTYDNFDSILSNKAVDAVYVALPNSMHADFTIRAAKAGKHVLCEKPMAINVAECEQMIAACKSASVKLMIAYRCHYEPTNLKAVDLIRTGAIGQVQAIETAFGFNERLGEWRLDKKLSGGGPLMDVGIYSLNATPLSHRRGAGQLLSVQLRHRSRRPLHAVEENISWTMKFPSGIVASCATTYGGQMGGFFKVHGAKGWIDADPAFNYDGLRLRAEYSRAHRLDEANPQKNPYQFTAQAESLLQLRPEQPGAQNSGRRGPARHALHHRNLSHRRHLHAVTIMDVDWLCTEHPSSARQLLGPSSCHRSHAPGSQQPDSCASWSTSKRPASKSPRLLPWPQAARCRFPSPRLRSCMVLPAYCRVEGVINRRKGVGGEEFGIQFALAMPDPWNGDFLMQGGAGGNGIVYPPLGQLASGDKPALMRGYAVVSTDTGHKSHSGAFDFGFMKDQQAYLDFAYRGQHRKSPPSPNKSSRTYYGKPAAYSYFTGCSTGGREGMVLSQRYPTEDFDGIIVGDPAMRTGLSGLAIAGWIPAAFNQIAPKDADGKPIITQAITDDDRKLIMDALMKQCDALDGLADGLISDPLACHFDPEIVGLQARPDCLLPGARKGRRHQESPRRSKNIRRSSGLSGIPL